MICLLASCNALSDPLDTGLKVNPEPGEWEGPVDLSIINRSGQDITCTLFEDEHCPKLHDSVPFPDVLAAGDRWDVLEVTCASVDIACRHVDELPTRIPLRSWGWFVQPALDDE
jgi:hypothetical protein